MRLSGRSNTGRGLVSCQSFIWRKEPSDCTATELKQFT